LQLRLVVEDKIIAFYRLDDGVRLLPLEELNIALEQQAQRIEEESQRADRESQRADREAQRARDLEAQIAIYQQQLGELPTEQPNLLE
jgi:chromosome condensin MukBEF ATPase and DNA-binding subunit MukB